MNVRHPNVFDKYRTTHGMTANTVNSHHAHTCDIGDEEEVGEDEDDDTYAYGQVAQEGPSDDEDGHEVNEDNVEMDDDQSNVQDECNIDSGGGMNNSDGEQTHTGTNESHVVTMEDVSPMENVAPVQEDTLMNTQYYKDGEKVYAMSVEVDAGTWWPATVKSSTYDQDNETMTYNVQFEQGKEYQLTTQENVCSANAFTQQNESTIKEVDVLVFNYNGKSGRFYRGKVVELKTHRRKKTFQLEMPPIGRDGVLERLHNEYNNIQERIYGLGRSGITISSEDKAKYNTSLNELEAQVVKYKTPSYRNGKEDTYWWHWCDDKSNIFVIQ
ncbi:hypothetical protein SAMD00019534_095330 [Acytostelium subglobosum LB1]|uniref:hypothetical protein n=1 Tax=Acytostelium subglobosum LB1 TaxID=1410327 RepID=UPI000644988F|nr:hypothetical protein SAMD00019534_095330 [Acytostelium subglobosum LB1]GAM26358.1 hypothetical protein SAMD00019534_095330 [Acytostelium subglobosum LB1]|eukprot:XP_012750912.1 hypothetical protein SAMD00019534_095330 [Acytostelium subglobosum LB1]